MYSKVIGVGKKTKTKKNTQKNKKTKRNTSQKLVFKYEKKN